MSAVKLSRVIADNDAERAAMIYAEAVVSVAQEVLADPEWTARVVIAAIVAQDNVARDSAAWAALDGALTCR